MKGAMLPMPVKDNNSSPRKSLIYYYIIALVVLMLLNTFLFPSLLSRPVVEVTYDAFLKMLDAGEVKQVALEDTMLVFAAEDAEGNAAIFKTGIWPDDNLTERLVNAEGVQFAAEIPTQASPLLSFLLSWLMPILVFVIIGQIFSRMLKKSGAMNTMSFGKSNAKIYAEAQTGVTFADVAGEEEAKEALQEIVDFLRDPGKFTKVGARIPKGVLLEGPPGTGKTSIARSVAEALNKKYVRICLGGVRDEAEIRGHRKTYVGAMPGRITVALKEAGVSNPLMLLDEIDKTSSDYKGDTSAALLEVLDPEQNSKFNDHYVEIPQDLSEVLFIATANDVQGIPRPLLDRMELMEIPGYTENEKEHIAREHLIPKQMEINGIPEGKLVIQPAALGKLINNYTKEAGVRSLERSIGRICRKTARAIMEEGKDKVVVTSRNISRFLGKERYNYLMANEKDEIGIARGLAWTQVGGDTLQIEVNIMPGKGELLLTGQLGDVMKESAQAGISYIRSVSDQYEIDPEFFQKHDMHVHIPEGAVPKDGPSAGITMATAMLSAIIEKPVRADLAMTGEITLRGRVLPIGGLKEKLLAAKYARIKEVLVPEKNRPDIEEMDREIIQGLDIRFVDNMKEVLGEALA